MSASDGSHTMQELYDYRAAYNALLFNEWGMSGKHDVHKSLKHSDGELCFGGGWFIVVANTRWGQITNHYPLSDWNMFDIPARDKASEYDGHTPEEALKRLQNLIADDDHWQHPH